MGEIIGLKKVTKTYEMGKEKIFALNRVDLTIKQGEFLSIMGTSGSGKSTLLQLIAGLDRPTEGEIYLNGKPISKFSDTELTLFRREKMGFIFQFFNLLPTLTAEENAALPLLMMGRPRSEWKPEVDKWFKQVGLETRKNHFPSELSGGQLQRVAIIRALINKPLIILADEPTGNLDSKTGEEILFLLKGVVEDLGTTLILVTHDPKVAAYSNRLITMKDGQILSNLQGVGGLC